MNIRKLHLPASIKMLGVLFAFLAFGLFGLLSQRNTVFAQSPCTSYVTCHFYNGPGAAACPSGGQPDPFQLCYCVRFDDGSFEKVKVNYCWSQQLCDEYMDWRSPANSYACLEYGDICGCSGIPKLPSTPTPPPTPTSTPTPPRAGCYQPCRSDVDCQSPLVCGYHVNAGQRVCHNPACAGENDCTCDWQNSGIQAAFSRLKALGRKSQESSNQTNKNSFAGQISQSLSSGLERAWKRLKNLKS